MIYISFFLILLGSATFIASLIGLIYRLVIIGAMTKEDLITKRIFKFGLGGLSLVLFGQVIIRLAL